jgi:hypothetical protein
VDTIGLYTVGLTTHRQARTTLSLHLKATSDTLARSSARVTSTGWLLEARRGEGQFTRLGSGQRKPLCTYIAMFFLFDLRWGFGALWSEALLFIFIVEMLFLCRSGKRD